MKEEYSLFIKSVVYPIKYCQILNKILIDPSLTEIQNADLVVTVLKDLKNFENPPTVIQKITKLRSNDNESNIINVMKTWEVDVNKFKSNF